MELSIGSSIKISHPSKEVREWCERTLVLGNPDYERKERMGLWLGNTPETLSLYSREGSSLVVPFGCLREVWKMAKGSPYEARFAPAPRISLEGDPNLYPYQRKAVEAALRGKSGVLVAPCGSGKTQMGLAIAQGVGLRTLWLTHAKKLLRQSEQRCLSLFPRAKVAETTEGKFAIGEDVTFATVQTLSKCDPSLYAEAFGCVIVDEAHHCVGSPTQAKMFYRVVSNCNARYKFGLTATPERNDGLTRCMTACLGPVLHEVAREEVGGKIVPATHVRVDWNKKYEPVAYLSPDGMTDFLRLTNLLTLDPDRNAFIAEKAVAYYEQGRRQLLLTSRVAHCKELAALIRRKIPETEEIYGSKPDGKRDFSAPVIVATYSLAKEGLDVPSLDAVHFCTPIKDPIEARQCAGRVERESEGKKPPIVVDYVDTGVPYCERAYRSRRRALNKNKSK